MSAPAGGGRALDAAVRTTPAPGVPVSKANAAAQDAAVRTEQEERPDGLD